MLKRLAFCCLFPIAAASFAQTPSVSPTLAKVRAAHALNCGVDFEEAEYSTDDAHGNHSRFDLDVCKAIAVAVLGPNAKFNAVPYRDERDALKGLADGEIDVLATGSVNYRDTAQLALGFAPPIFHDDQALLVNKANGIRSVKDLAGKKVCFLGSTEYEQQLQATMQRKGIAWLPFSFQEEGEMEAAFITGNCAAITADRSQLAYERLAFHGIAAEYEILPDVIAPDPLAPAYRLDDPRWATLINWVTNTLLLAEESDVTQANVLAKRSSDDMPTQRLLGVIHGNGQYLGLPDDWAVPVIQAVGNYGELYERTLGSRSVMRLPRGVDQLSVHGGVLDPLPIR